MPPDLDTAFRALVAEEVDAALAPFRPALELISALLGGAPSTPRRGPGRPPSNGAQARRGRRPAGAVSQSRGDASRFKAGMRVKFNVGRGKRTGKVVEVDLGTNSVLVKRDDTGKEVKRPARGVSAA